MKIEIVLGLALLFATSPIVVAANAQEPKDSFILFGVTVDYATSAVVNLPVETPKKPATVKHKTVVTNLTNSNTKGWNVAKASQYGGSDGFYYGHFACGGIYYPNVVGVAHKSIRCGTLITFKYYGTKRINGKYVRGWYTATIKVVDRGPYCCGRSWDFTVQAATKLGFRGVGTVYWKYAK